MPLDPGTALSVAGFVVQLIDFSLTIISKSKDLYNSNNGILKENSETESVTIRLKHMAQRLQNMNSNEYDHDSLVRQDRVREICKDSLEASDELLRHLGELKVPTWSEHRKWKSFRQALKSVWSKQAVDQMAKRLEVLRAELNTYILETIGYVKKSP